VVNICLTFNFAESKTFSFILEDFDKTSSLAYLVRASTKQWLKACSCQRSVQGGKDTIPNGKAVSLVEMWGKQLSNMEEVLIMGLVVRQLVILALV